MPAECVCRAHESEVRERLRHVADLPSACDVVLLREEPDIVHEPDESVHQDARVASPPARRVLLHEPEAASQKRVLPTVETIDPGCRAISHEQSITQQRLLHLLDGAQHPRVIRGAESDLRKGEK